jgi:hypothetical protein
MVQSGSSELEPADITASARYELSFTVQGPLSVRLEQVSKGCLDARFIITESSEFVMALAIMRSSGYRQAVLPAFTCNTGQRSGVMKKLYSNQCLLNRIFC